MKFEQQSLLVQVGRLGRVFSPMGAARVEGGEGREFNDWALQTSGWGSFPTFTDFCYCTSSASLPSSATTSTLTLAKVSFNLHFSTHPPTPLDRKSKI